MLNSTYSAGVRGVDGGEVQVRVHDLVVLGHLEVRRRDGAFAPADVEDKRAGAVGEGAQPHLLHVEEELDRVLLDVRDRGELVLHAVDADGRYGRARERAQEHAAQGVAERHAEARRERRRDDARVVAISLVSSTSIWGSSEGCWIMATPVPPVLRLGKAAILA